MAVRERNEQEENKEEKIKKYYGEPMAYDPSFKGPNSVKRSCTDVVFLALFLVYIGLWIGVAIYAIHNGDINKLVAPKSSYRSQLCGYDPEVKSKPYLMFFDLSKCLKPIPATGCNTPQVCVEKCPDKPFLWDSVNRSSFNPNDLICQGNINTPKTMSEAQVRIQNGECARYYLPSRPVLMRCLPFDNAVEQSPAISNRFNRELSTDVLKTNFKDTTDKDENFKKVVEDLSNCWKELILYGIVALFVSLLVIFLLKWFTGIITWGCLIGGLVLGVFGIYFFAKQYTKLDSSSSDQQIISKRKLSIYMTILFAISTGIGLFMIIFLRKKIMLTIAIFEETAKSVLSNIMSLFFPLVPWLLQLVVLMFTVCVALYIIAIVESEYRFYGSQSSCKCTGEAAGYKDGSICSPKLFTSLCKENGNTCTTASCTPKHNVSYLHAINVFGFIWVTFFLSAFGEMVLAGTFATWYFTFNKDEVPFFGILHSMKITMRYHLGTLAFGSLIVAIVRMIRVIMEYADQQMKEGGNNNIGVQVFLCIVRCCLSCLENVIKFINRNAYIMCAIHGTNFCTSAKNAFLLIMRNMLQIMVILNVTSFLIFINELIITLTVMALAYFISFSDNSAFHFNWLPVLIVGIISFLVATIFFTVFSMGIDTLFICFLQDLERNDGSAQKPYYMSKNLMKIFDKKNE